MKRSSVPFIEIVQIALSPAGNQGKKASKFLQRVKLDIQKFLKRVLFVNALCEVFKQSCVKATPSEFHITFYSSPEY